MTRVSKSSLETFARCPRLYRYKYIDNYEAINEKDSESLVLGLGFHDWLEKEYWSGQCSKGGPKQPSTVDGATGKGHLSVLLDVAQHSYRDLYGTPEKSDIKVLALEHKWEIPFKHGTLVGVFDAIIEYRGRTLVVESKTTRSPIHDKGNWPAFYFTKLDLDLQTGLYVWAARELGYDVDSVLYDVTRIPNTEPGKDGRKKIPGESLAEFESRIRVEVLNNQDMYHKRILHKPDVDEIMSQVYSWGDLMSYATEYPKNHNSCWMYGRFCEFRPVCTGKTSLDDEKLYQIRKR